jgi:enterochelin esterase-like enzyme
MKTQPIYLLLFAILITSIAVGQPASRPVIVSPEIYADNSVTFRFYAPAAKEVKLSAQFEKSPLAMTKDDKGTVSYLYYQSAELGTRPVVVYTPAGYELQEFKKDFFGNLMPFIERNYRTLNDKNNRAIAGFSGGGGTTLYFGLNNTDQVDECKTLSECHCA